MAITIEDIRNGIAENPDLKNQLLTDFDNELPEYVKGKGYHVQSADERTAWEKQYEDEKIKPRTKELYEGVEKDVLTSFDFLGIKKDNNNERAFDLIKKAGRVANERLADAEAKLAEALAGKGDDVTKAQLAALRTELEEAKQRADNAAAEFEQKAVGFKVNADFGKAFGDLKLVVPANVGEKDKAAYLANRQAMLEQVLKAKFTPKEENGQIVYTDANGAVQMKGANVATAKDLLEAEFKYDFVQPTKGGSGGAGSQQQGVPVIVQNKSQLYEQLSKEGLVAGSKEWQERATALAKENNITI